MKSDEELKQNFKIFVGKDNVINIVILRTELEPDANRRILELIKDDLFKIFNSDSNKKYDVFVDVSPIGGISRQGFNLGTRKIGAQMIANEQLKKAAIFAESMFIKVVVNFMITIAGKRKNIKFFLNKEEALRWLKEE